MLKKVFIRTFVVLLLVLFTYGYIVVYTNSYNVVHEDHITGLHFEYSTTDNAIHVTILGRDYTV